MDEMQRLHQLVVEGKALTAEETAALQDWYETQDREEDLSLGNSQSFQSTDDVREYLAKTTKQVAKISREIEGLVEQNTGLRDQNSSLRKALESRLVEKVA